MIILPVAVEPVKATFSIFGCLAMAAPAVAPKPETMLITPLAYRLRLTIGKDIKQIMGWIQQSSKQW